MGQKGNYDGKLKAIKGGGKGEFTDKVNDIPVNDPKEVKGEKKVVLVGFDRIAGDQKKKLEKLARQKGISSFSILGIPTRESVPKYSGGMIGDPSILVEGLYNMALQRPEIKALLEITVKALTETELLRVTSVSELLEKGAITHKIFNVLNDYEIYDLKKLAEFSVDEVAEFRNVGDKTLKDITKLLTDRGMDFRKN